MNEESINRVEESPKEISRRKFFLNLSLGIAGLSAAAAAIPVVSAINRTIIRKKNQKWRAVGKVDAISNRHHQPGNFY